tara:strand:- start:868 stop:1476 length:609 start_codon:yes stop_codon:yes gene_type:complete
VDIGANVGWFSKLIDNNFKNCKILSYELDEANFEILERRMNGYDRTNSVRVFNTAVIGANGFSKYWKSKDNIGGHKPIFHGTSSYISEDALTESMKKSLDLKGKFVETSVNKITLPQIIEKNKIDYVDFLKLDCEGSEYEILNYAMDKGICGKILNMVAEIHGKSQPQYKTFLKRMKENFEQVSVRGKILTATNKIIKGEIK